MDINNNIWVTMGFSSYGPLDVIPRACLKHEMAKWRNGEMTKWRNDEIELKSRATVIKYDRSTEISICCRIYFVVNRHK